MTYEEAKAEFFKIAKFTLPKWQENILDQIYKLQKENPGKIIELQQGGRYTYFNYMLLAQTIEDFRINEVKEGRMSEYTISLTVKKEINGKTYGSPYTYKTTFVEYDAYVNPNVKPFLENDKEFDRKELEIVFDLLLQKFYGKGDENAQ